MSSLERRLHHLTEARHFREINGIIIGLLLALVIGRSIAHGQLTPLLLLGGLIAFLLIFFRRHSLVYLFPLILVTPNFGLDIPGPWAITIQDAFVMVAFFAYLTRSIVFRERIFRWDDRLVAPMFVFLAIAGLCIIKVLWINPDNLMFNLKELMRLAMLFLFYLVLVDVLDSRTQVLRLTGLLLLGSLWMMVISYYIYFTVSPFWYDALVMEPAYIFIPQKILRMISIAGSTSYTGIYYAIILVLAMYYTPLTENRLRQVGRFLLLAALFSCIALSFNRGTWVGLLFGLTVLALQGHINRQRLILALVFTVAIVLLISASPFGQFDVERHITDFVRYSQRSAESRYVRWLSAINVILDHPFLGVGYNNYAFVYGYYSIQEGLERIYGSPHNLFVDIITGTGIFGFTVFMILIVRLWRQMLDNLRASLPDDLRRLSRGVFLAFLVFIGSDLFDSFLFKPHHSSYLIVAVWAMSTAIFRLQRDPADAAATGGPTQHAEHLS